MKLIVKNAQYGSMIFNILSNGINVVFFDKNKLTLSNNVASNYDFALSKILKSQYSITNNPSTKVAANAICIGRTTDGNAIVLYLNNSGQISRFNKTGVVSQMQVYTKGNSAYKITAAKGNSVNLQFTEDEIVVNGTITIPKSLFPDFGGWAVGGLVTGATEDTYYIE